MKLLRGKMVRVTKLDGCGAPVLGPDSVVTSKGIITIGLTANTFEGTTLTQEVMDGSRCINDVPVPRFEDFTVAITMCGVDPNLVNLMTANPLVYNDAATPEAYGIDITSDAPVDNSGFAIEIWTGTPSDACSEDGDVQFGYALLPFVKGGVIGDQSFENGVINFSVNGAKTKDGSQWGVGPYDVEIDATGADSPLLQPIGTKTHQRIIPTFLPPPEAVDGATALGVAATGATAGIPATLSPANSYAPADLAEAVTLEGLGDFTATPGTAWTTGQYVKLRDGSKAHWNSTDWVAGVA